VQCFGRGAPEQNAAGVLAKGPDPGLVVEAIYARLLTGPRAKISRKLYGLFPTACEAARLRGRGEGMPAVPHVLHRTVCTTDQHEDPGKEHGLD
jgi:hypothetical protein